MRIQEKAIRIFPVRIEVATVRTFCPIKRIKSRHLILAGKSNTIAFSRYMSCTDFGNHDEPC